MEIIIKNNSSVSHAHITNMKFPRFPPLPNLLGALHSDFGLPVVIDHNIVSSMAVAMAEKVKDKWLGLIHELKRIIEKWERSGQGGGGYMDNDAFGGDTDEGELRLAPKFGKLSNRLQGALDSCAVFFRDKESYLLYLWEVWEWNGLLVLSMQRLNNLAAATNGADGITSIVVAAKSGDNISVTTAGGNKHDKTKQNKELLVTINEHGKKMVFIAKMKCNQWEKDCSYAMQAEICASLCGLGAEKRLMIIQMQAEKVKK